MDCLTNYNEVFIKADTCINISSEAGAIICKRFRGRGKVKTLHPLKSVMSSEAEQYFVKHRYDGNRSKYIYSIQYMKL